MGDNEIIKALECCSSEDLTTLNCGHCPNQQSNCMHILYKSALDLINRQKAEIENYIKVAETQQSLSMERFFEIDRLSKRLEKRTTELDRLTIYFDKAVEEKLKTAKAEAIKEFAKELICWVEWTPIRGSFDYAGGYNDALNKAKEIIDNLVKEMVEGVMDNEN